ncbi:protein sprouty protein [Trichinella spiralis]|uniref:protein sprouty protein n=1 Tax=Trichinella spiralis TaxID=6334 RepID=UPI0001EFCE8F|nr:protein sprouty protein [Trichinella spiralis]
MSFYNRFKSIRAHIAMSQEVRNKRDNLMGNEKDCHCCNERARCILKSMIFVGVGFCCFIELFYENSSELENCDIMFDSSGCTVIKNKMTSENERYPKDPLPEKND